MIRADAEFREALRLRPTEPTARRHAGDLAYRQGDTVRGDSIFGVVFSQMRQWPPRSMTHLSALQAFSTRDTARQSRVLDTLRTSGERLVVMAVWVVSLYNPVPADIRPLAALLTAPDRPVSSSALGHRTLAYLALAEDDFASADRHLKLADSLDPEEALVLEGYLRLTGRLGTGSDASRTILERLQIWSPEGAAPSERVVPETVHPIIAPSARSYLLALAALEQGDMAAVEAAARRLELARPLLRGLEPSLAASLRARAALARGDTARALALLEPSWLGIQFEPGRASPIVSRPADRILMGNLLARTGNPEGARGWYATISELSPWDLAWLPEAQRGLAALEDSAR